MDTGEEQDRLKALNLLGRTVEVSVKSTTLRGEVFFFNDKLLILTVGSDYVMINITSYDDIKVAVRVLAHALHEGGRAMDEERE